MTIISFIFHFTRDLVLCLSEARAVLRSRGKLKRKDMKVIQYVILHDCRFLCPKKHKKKREQKIKINATQNNYVPVELGKQHHTGEKKDWLDRPAKFQPKFTGNAQVWTFPGSWRMSACQRVNYGGSFGFFLICPRLMEDSKTGIHQATMAKIKL